MPRKIKTANEHTADIISLNKRLNKEKRQHVRAVNAEQQRRENYEYMRDELMSAVKNNGMSFADIHGHCGPHPKTLEGYAQKTTQRPQMAKMQSVADIIGLRWKLVPKD